jgi:hypothetical protein
MIIDGSHCEAPRAPREPTDACSLYLIVMQRSRYSIYSSHFSLTPLHHARLTLRSIQTIARRSCSNINCQNGRPGKDTHRIRLSFHWIHR